MVEVSESVQRWFVAGAAGFVGSSVTQALEGSGVHVTHLPLREASDDEIVRTMATCSVVVNAAGMAAPKSQDASSLEIANVELPRRLAELADRAGVETFLHVSSGAVQGGRRTLDEHPSYAPFSPYSESKANAERGLLGGSWRVPPNTIVYRPASILGEGRRLTRQLVAMFALPMVPVFGDGSQPLPIATVDRVAEALILLGNRADGQRIVAHPWEGVTQRSLAEALSPPNARLVSLPVPSRSVAKRLRPLLPKPAVPIARQLDLLAYGQRQDTQYLKALGFPASDSQSDLRKLRAIAGGRNG